MLEPIECATMSTWVCGMRLYRIDEGLEDLVLRRLVIVVLRRAAFAGIEIGDAEQFAVLVAARLQFVVDRIGRRGVARHRAGRHVETDRAVAVAVDVDHRRARRRAGAGAAETAAAHAGTEAARVLRGRAGAGETIVGAAGQRLRLPRQQHCGCAQCGQGERQQRGRRRGQ